ncbi:unnamed protein product [Dovyalis caffra]|uniref:Uncharacterized protein n=1 Tax=Dovyalis caffra TaxID=77055 RepID=A0AAV1SBD4_9ROSI|nr:unnamed protein product [Dovyalis caffra]
MSRQNGFPVAEKSDSDQSISDEEDFDVDLGENRVSLTGSTKKEEGWELQSRLDMLRDEAEMPDFPSKGGFFFSPSKGSARNSKDEVACDDEDNYAFLEYPIISSDKKFDKDNSRRGFGSEKQAEAYTWSIVNKEAETLISLNENALSSHSAYSKANKSHKGNAQLVYVELLGRMGMHLLINLDYAASRVRGKAKPKFAFHFQSHKDGLSQPFVSKDAVSSMVDDGPERSETIELKILEEIEPAEDDALGDGFVDHSMAELLDDLRDKNILPRGNSKMVSILLFIDDEDQPEPMAGSSSDDKINYQNINFADLEIKKQTMADLIHEALAASSVSNEGVFITAAKPSGIGLSGKLQRVVQSEKERDTEFLKKLQIGASPNSEPCSIVVKILSRYFDAKLIVCHCTFGENIKGSKSPESSKTFVDSGRTRTVIFTPRVCSSVDLDPERMKNKPLEITIISGVGLKKVEHLSKMNVYVVAIISSDPTTEQKTAIDRYAVSLENRGEPNVPYNTLFAFKVSSVGYISTTRKRRRIR